MKKDNITGYPKYSQIQLARLVGLKSQGKISRIINKYSSVGLE